MKTIQLLKINYSRLSGNQLFAKTVDGRPMIFMCSETQAKELTALSPFIYEGNSFNLLNAIEEDGFYTAEFIVFEPDYLIDTSSLAECFRAYGNHPLNYTLSRLQSRELTSPLLLGNTANFFIDEFVNEDENKQVDYATSLKKLFQIYAFEFTACEDLKNPSLETDFFANCRIHFKHIKEVVEKIFPKASIDREKLVLEPAFISNALGLQGRLDVMSHDFSCFIELKSGKAMEDYRTGGQFIHSAINHYIQMILYLAILEFNLDLDSENVRSYLLYSKYPLLSKEKHSRKKLEEALFLRNKIVAVEYFLQKENKNASTLRILENIDSKHLNQANISGKFFENYLSPSINQFKISFSLLNETEKEYVLRLYTFITKELWLSKAGEREYEGVKKSSVLWNASFEDKLIAGEILYDLTISDNRAAAETHTVELKIPEYTDLYLPNFRPGDAVVLYERKDISDTVNNHQVFKGSIEILASDSIKIRLRYRQKNLLVWNTDALYAVEHDYMDSTYTGMYRALTSFIHANQKRKDLLLCKRFPTPPPCPLHQKSQETVIANGVKQSSFDTEPSEKMETCPDNSSSLLGRRLGGEAEAFLLVGPPGTGKTSIALKQMVENEIKKNDTNILLLSYTNRAVDEICKALTDISQSLPYIRIGSELNCSPEFRPRLLEKFLDQCNNRKDVATIINRCRIFVGTVASVWNKPELFNLKQFDLAIVDEATQLLEPHLLGVLSVKTPAGEDAIKRFVLIGDHKQLPAIVLQTKKESEVNEPLLQEAGLTNLSDSLFERLYRKYHEKGLTNAFGILSKQGRMHPEISAFPSENFYEGQLASVGLPHQKEEWKDKRRLTFYPVQPSKEDQNEKMNLNEAKEVVTICKKLFLDCENNRSLFEPQEIGIITPFRNQIALIRKELQKTKIDAFSRITVDTVERFQGSQRDTIIYSFCIKTKGQLAALPNEIEENGKRIDRKLNVVLTRARKQLHIIGNEDLLRKNLIYKQLIEHIKRG